MYSDDIMEEVEELDEVNTLGLTDMEALISFLVPVLTVATGFASSVIKGKLKTAKTAKELKAKAEEIAKESEDMKSDGVETLRSELNEVNLLNAKLLYTNKIFKSKNLTESQKVKVLNSFDKTTTVKEVKLVYETLNEGITTNKKSLSENLGSASKAIGTTKKPIIEANDAFSRMREIAFYSAKH
jgi:CHASE3 domain sensor protein